MLEQFVENVNCFWSSLFLERQTAACSLIHRATRGHGVTVILEARPAQTFSRDVNVRCWLVACCVNVTSDTVTHFCCWLYYFIHCQSPQNHIQAEYISLCFHKVHIHIVFARLQKQFSSASEHQPPSYLLLYFPIWVAAALWAHKKLDFTTSMTVAGVADVFSVMMGLCILSRSPPGIWDEERERTWRARWGPWMRVYDWSSSWLRRECCSGGRNRYTGFTELTGCMEFKVLESCGLWMWM